MIDAQLDRVVSRYAKGVCGFYWASEIERGELLRDVPRLVVPAIIALLEVLESQETEQSPWSRIELDSPAAKLVPALAFRCGLIRLASATYMDGSVAHFARRTSLN